MPVGAPQMAFRSLTDKFELYRNDARMRHQREKQQHPEQLTDIEDTHIALKLHELPPRYVDIVETAHNAMKSIKDNRMLLIASSARLGGCGTAQLFSYCGVSCSGISDKKLKKLHDERLKISFGGEDEKKKQQDVDTMTDEITRVRYGPLLCGTSLVDSFSFSLSLSISLSRLTVIQSGRKGA